MKKLSDYVVDFVADQGVGHVFLLPGGGCMHLVDSVGSNPRLEFVCNLHEQACAIAADAYGQYTNHLGVALVTTGPGGTNAITGVAGAWLDSTPCLFLSGQVKRPDLKGDRRVRQIGFQEVDIVRLVEPITKYAVCVTDPGSIRYHLEKAVRLAREGRPGPVWVDIPLDVQAAWIDPDTLPGEPEGGPAGEAHEQEAHLDALVRRAIGLLNEAERPVVLVGNGVRLARALDGFSALIERLGVPVLTTWKALDLLADDHPLYAGRPGAVGQRGANFTQQNADFLLCLGARLDLGQTAYNHGNFARHARKVVVDVDRGEIEKLEMTVDVPVVADAGAFIAAWLSRDHLRVPKDRSGWLARARAWQAKYPLVLPEYRAYRDGVSNYVLVEVLSEEMDGGDLLVPGSSGASSEITMQAFPVKRGMRVFNTEGLGPMGFAIPAAIGGCLASGRRRTVSIDGDGGFVMNNQELETVRRLGLPIKFFVLNNQGYASIQSTQRGYFGGHLVASGPSSGLTLPAIRKVAEAYGLATALIRNHDDLRPTIRSVLDAPGPVVCEVMISPQHATAPRLSSAQKPDGSFESKPMEDLFPFLGREEFRSNMLSARAAE